MCERLICGMREPWVHSKGQMEWVGQFLSVASFCCRYCKGKRTTATTILSLGCVWGWSCPEKVCCSHLMLATVSSGHRRLPPTPGITKS
ncbi:rCG63259 [Rattus norvegicus]|uniref:RCG63259 n=1 Tax=Rattus norvegicus TaxID=10116 RepID=A6JGD2_RAT|nr:rCG63259 [Rattus norvegicus]